MHLAVLIQVFQLLHCSVDDTGNTSVSNKQEAMIVSEVYYNKHVICWLGGPYSEKLLPRS